MIMKAASKLYLKAWHIQMVVAMGALQRKKFDVEPRLRKDHPTPMIQNFVIILWSSAPIFSSLLKKTVS